MRNVLHLPSSGQMQRSHNADCASAQLFYPTPSQPWINATKYGEWQLPTRSPMVAPWDADRSHQEHPNSWTQQEAFWCHFTIRLSVGRAQHACILDMKNTPFWLYGNLDKAECWGPGLLHLQTGLLLLACLPHSFYLWSSQGEKGSRRACGKLYIQQHSKKR